MKIHFTNLFGQSSKSVALMAQNDIMNVVRELGVNELFIHDVPPLMFESNYYLMPNYIDMYNQSDLVVVPSEQMYHRLVSEGLTVKKYVVQKLWDLTHSLDLYTPQFEKKLIFSGNPSRFPHIIDWKYETLLQLVRYRHEGVSHISNR